MKKLLLLIIALLVLSATGVKAQAPNANDIGTLLSQLGCPYVYVTTADTTGWTAGYVSFSQSYTFTGILGSGNHFALYGGGNVGFYERQLSGSLWSYPWASKPLMTLNNAATGQPIVLKVKGNGKVKPIQISMDGRFCVIFGTDGYYYQVTINESEGTDANGKVIVGINLITAD